MAAPGSPSWTHRAAHVRAWLLQKSAPVTVHYGRSLQLAGQDLPRAERFSVRTRHGSVRCEIHRPPGVTRPPAFVHFHGGAFIMRHPRMDEFWARYLAAEAGVAVVSVDYDAAPQVRYPVAQEQAHDVLVHVSRRGADLGVDGDRVGVGGFSAGGNLAAAACLQARDSATVEPRFLLLGVPSLDVTQSWEEKRAQMSAQQRSASTPMLGAAIIDLVRATYFRDPERRSEALASPLQAASLAGLPPALVVTAEHDLLRAEGDAFAGRLAQGGVAVEHVVVPGRDHYFLDTRNAPALMARMAASVRAALSAERDITDT